MRKVKLSESEIRSVIRAALLEQDPAGDASGMNPRDVKINDDTAPGIDTQTSKLETFLAQIISGEVGGRDHSVTSILDKITEYSKISGYTGVIEQRTPIEDESIQNTRIQITKELIRYEIMLALDSKLPRQDAEEKT